MVGGAQASLSKKNLRQNLNIDNLYQSDEERYMHNLELCWLGYSLGNTGTTTYPGEFNMADME